MTPSGLGWAERSFDRDDMAQRRNGILSFFFPLLLEEATTGGVAGTPSRRRRPTPRAIPVHVALAVG